MAGLQETTFKKLTKVITGAIAGAASPDKDDDIKLNPRELLKWIRKYNKEMLVTGQPYMVITMYDTAGRLDPEAMRKGMAIYTAEYLKARQPFVAVRDDLTGITLTGEDYMYQTVKTKTRGVDAVIVSASRALETPLDDPVYGLRERVGEHNVPQARALKKPGEQRGEL